MYFLFKIALALNNYQIVTSLMDINTKWNLRKMENENYFMECKWLKSCC